eukprot:1402701-Amphidinium_carterae.1
MLMMARKRGCLTCTLLRSYKSFQQASDAHISLTITSLDAHLVSSRKVSPQLKNCNPTGSQRQRYGHHVVRVAFVNLSSSSRAKISVAQETPRKMARTARHRSKHSAWKTCRQGSLQASNAGMEGSMTRHA